MCPCVLLSGNPLPSPTPSLLYLLCRWPMAEMPVGASPLKEQQTWRRRRRRGACSRRVLAARAAQPPPPPLAAPIPPAAPPPPPAREETTDTLDRCPILPYLCHTPGNPPPRVPKAFTPWSSTLGGRLRTISANTTVRIGHVEVPSSDHGDRPSKKKPAEPRCSPRHLSDHCGIFLMGPRIVPEQLMGCPICSFANIAST
jgi:hypothetical protein